jgi:predicted nucleic acid-binding protein
MIIIDANILISAAVGQTGKVLQEALDRQIRLATTDAQLEEALSILEVKSFASSNDIARFKQKMLDNIALLRIADLLPFKILALERLHDRAEPDWPLLASAIMYKAAIWSHDRDFFGVGVPIWSTRNMCFAEVA